MKLATLCLAASALLASNATQAQNIVDDGGFEAGSLQGHWQTSSWGTTSMIDGSLAHSGQDMAFTSCAGAGCMSYGSGGASLSQQLTTSAGTTYTLDFFVHYDVEAPTDNEVAVYWGGQKVFDQSASPQTGGWVEYTVQGLSGAAGTTQLTFLGRQNPGEIGLDDVSVVATGTVAAVPEPATTALTGAGLAALAWVQRRTVRRS